ncbi:MAG: hypothetical protein WC485_05950, partial [Opitutaceae bacterium]
MKKLSSSSLGRASGQWLQVLRQAGRVEATLKINAWALAKFDAFLRLQKGRPVGIDDVSPADALRWQKHLVERGLKPSSQERILGPLCTFFRWLEKQGLLFKNPCQQLILPRYEKPLLPVPTEVEMLRVLAGI